jgi:hypothetical protein
MPIEASLQKSELLKPEHESGLTNALSEVYQWGKEHKIELGVAAAASVLGGTAFALLSRRSISGLAERPVAELAAQPAERLSVQSHTLSEMETMPWLRDPDYFKPKPSKGPILDAIIDGYARAGIAMR